MDNTTWSPRACARVITRGPTENLVPPHTRGSVSLSLLPRHPPNCRSSCFGCMESHEAASIICQALPAAPAAADSPAAAMPAPGPAPAPVAGSAPVPAAAAAAVAAEAAVAAPEYSGAKYK